MENLEQLQDPKSGIDVGFVQGGIIQAQAYSDAVAKAATAKQPPPSISQMTVPQPKDLESLGSIAYQPIWIFYRGNAPMQRLSELAGKRIAVGKVGSGTHMLATALLQANKLTEANATLVQDDAASAAAGLVKGTYDAIFLMGEAAPTSVLLSMIREPGIRIFDFVQADAYVRRFNYLNRMRLPQGSFDLGQNQPSQDISLVGPTVELVARKGLNPAIVQLLIEAAREVNGKASILQRQGEFPAPLEHEFTVSDEAKRYYKSGKGFLAGAIDNIWLASLISRIAVAFVPVFLVMIPVLRVLPIAYRLRIHLRIYRCYRPLLQLERDVSGPLSRDRARELLGRLDDVEREVDRLKVPASFGEQYYELRQHVAFVRKRLEIAASSDGGIAAAKGVTKV